MKKVLLATLSGLFMSTAVNAETITIFNNSERYEMYVEYLVCTDMEKTSTCSGPYGANIPSSRVGRNYTQVQVPWLIVTKVVEKDVYGNVRMTSNFWPNYKGCRADYRYTKNNDVIENALVLDDMHGSDIITCTRSIIPTGYLAGAKEKADVELLPHTT